jgi:hypothetical protein
MTVKDNREKSFAWETAYLVAFEARGVLVEHEQPHGVRRPDFSGPDDGGLRHLFIEIKAHDPNEKTGIIRFHEGEMSQLKDEVTLGVSEKSEQRTLVVAMEREHLAQDQREELLDHARNAGGRLIIADLKEVQNNADLVSEIIKRGVSEALRDRADEFSAYDSGYRDPSEAQLVDENGSAKQVADFELNERGKLILDTEQGDDGKKWEAALTNDVALDLTESAEELDVGRERETAGFDAGDDKAPSGRDDLTNTDYETGKLIVDDEQADDGRKWEAALTEDGEVDDVAEIPERVDVEPDGIGSDGAADGRENLREFEDQTGKLIVDDQQGDDGRKWEAALTDDGEVDAGAASEGTDVGPEAGVLEGFIDLNPVFGPSQQN